MAFAGNVGRNPSPPTFYGNHRDGDMLIRSFFVNGGSSMQYKIYKWVSGAPVEQSYPASTALVMSNTGTPNVPTGMFSGFSYAYKSTGSAGSPTNPGSGKYAQSTFLEGSLDLDAIANDPLAQCFQSYIITTTTSSSLSLTQSYTDIVTGNFPSKPLAYVTNANMSVCKGDAMSFLGGAQPGYGTAPYTYVWSTDPNCTTGPCVVGTAPTLSISNPTASGSYYLTAFSSYGCVSIPVEARLTVKPSYSITATPDAYGTITHDGINDAITSVCEGKDITFNFNSAYPVQSVMVDGSLVAGAPSSYTFTSVNANHTIAVTFCNPTTTVSQADLTANTEAGKCEANVSLSGAVANGNPAPSISYSALSGAFAGGSTPVSVTASNSCGTASASFNVVVIDNQFPAINGIGDITKDNDLNACGAMVDLSGVTVSDNCSGATLKNDFTGSFFPIGTTTITWTATDAAGHVTTAIQHVTIKDVQAPTLAVPADISVNANNDGCTWIGDYGMATPGDNCDVLPVVNDAPLSFPVGTTIITWSVTDIHGNTTTATQAVTVTNPLSVNVAGSITPAITNGTQTGGLYWGYQSQKFTATANNATGAVTYTWTSGGTGCEKLCSITAAGSTNFSQTVIATDAIGCSATATGLATQNVLDYRCGNDNSKMAICHWNSGKSEWKTLCIDAASVPDHMGHTHTQSGHLVYDYCGPCHEAAKGASAVAAKEISLFPNPNNGSFTMEIPAIASELHIAIVDMNGRVVETRTVAASDQEQHLEIGLSNVSKGIYMLQAVGGEQNFHTKLVIE